MRNMTRPLTLCDLDFTDLHIEDDKDDLMPRGAGNSIPPPPPPIGMMKQMPPNSLIPPPAFKIMNGSKTNDSADANGNTIKKNKKTVSLIEMTVHKSARK